MENNLFILVSGYCWSGSSAVVDLLKEYSCNIDPGIEFRLIKDPYGINDLYNAMVVKGDPLNCDIAIKDYLWFVECLNRKPSKLKHGLNYQSYFGDNLLKYTQEYINRLVQYKYDAYWWMFDLKRDKLDMLIYKLKLKFLHKKEQPQMYFSNITEKSFCEETNTYINKLLLDVVGENKDKNIILDQAVSVFNAPNEMKFLKNRKLIVVDRDPRDVYTELCKGGFLIGEQLIKTRNPMMYVDWHNAWRRNIKQLENNNDILQIKFEDLIIDYADTVKKIEKFLNLDKNMHVFAGEYLDVNMSKKNVGIWKGFLNNEEIKVFDKYLGNFYYSK